MHPVSYLDYHLSTVPVPGRESLPVLCPALVLPGELVIPVTVSAAAGASPVKTNTFKHCSRMPGSTYSQDTIGEEKKAAQRTSITLFYAVCASAAAAVLWLLSFSSPYWLASWADTRTDQKFLNMGLWTFCFDRYRHPEQQFDRLYTGCHPIWGFEYREIREWMAPWWLMLIQFISVVGFILMNIGLVLDVALYLRTPMEHVLR